MQTRRKLRLPSPIPTKTKENLTNQWLKQPTLFCSEESIVQTRRKLRLLGNFNLSSCICSSIKHNGVLLYHHLLKNSAIIRSVKKCVILQNCAWCLHRCSKMTLIYIAHSMLTIMVTFYFPTCKPGWPNPCSKQPIWLWVAKKECDSTKWSTDI